MNFKQELRRLLRDNKAQADGTSTLYMVVVIAIVALVLISVIKPMFNSNIKTSVNLADLPNAGTTAASTPAPAPTTGTT